MTDRALWWDDHRLPIIADTHPDDTHVLVAADYDSPRARQDAWLRTLTPGEPKALPSFGVDAPPGTIHLPGDRVVLRVAAHDWLPWWEARRYEGGTFDKPHPLPFPDQHTGVRWRVYLDSVSPVEFKAMVAGPYTMRLPLDTTLRDESLPLVLARFPDAAGERTSR